MYHQVRNLNKENISFKICWYSSEHQPHNINRVFILQYTPLECVYRLVCFGLSGFSSFLNGFNWFSRPYSSGLLHWLPSMIRRKSSDYPSDSEIRPTINMKKRYQSTTNHNKTSPVCINTLKPRQFLATISHTAFSQAFSWCQCLKFSEDFTEVCSQGSIQQYSNIGSDNGLSPTRR